MKDNKTNSIILLMIIARGESFALTQEQITLTLLKNRDGYLTAKMVGENGVSPSTLKLMEE